MAPIQLQLDFNKCRKLLAELSHSVQRLLTEYVSIKVNVLLTYLNNNNNYNGLFIEVKLF